MVNYGIEGFGKHYIIKLRAKLLDNDRDMLRTKFNANLNFSKTLKGYTLIEGCLPFREYPEFREMLDVAMLDSKIATLQAKKEAVVNPPVWHPEDVDML